MAKSSQPLDIKGTRPREDQPETSGSLGRGGPVTGTPTTRNGGRGTPATPPSANIPPRLGDELPASVSLTRSSPLRPQTPQTGGSIAPTGASPSGMRSNLDEVTEEDMARVLWRHLVPRRGGDGDADGISIGGCWHPSEYVPSSTRNGRSGGENDDQPSGPQRQDSEVFPIPYDGAGGVITYVFAMIRHYLSSKLVHIRNSIYKWQDE